MERVNNPNNRKWFLMLCELHCPGIHGKTDDSDANIETHYLIYDRFDGKTGISFQDLDQYEEYDTDTEDDEDNQYNGPIKINDSIDHLRTFYNNVYDINNAGIHPYIRNYRNIVSRPDYIKPEIGQYIMLPTLETVAILKTFWLRIIQRAWKKVFKQRLALLKNPRTILNRELYAISLTSLLPGIRGMLRGLNK